MKKTKITTTSTMIRATGERWPALPLEEWQDTYTTLHMWTQVVGKVKLALQPYMNHWWQVAFYITARGMTTAATPYSNGIFEVHFDFIDHQLTINTDNGGRKSIPLIARSVADFYQEFIAALQALGIEVTINTRPSEVQDPIPFEQDQIHASYDRDYVNRFWRILVQVEKVLKDYRSQFIGKASPIHFFWGAFDMALTFFSGQPAPERKGADAMTREGYSHEVISCGFWPGGGKIKGPAFYSYTVPEPPELKTARIRPESAFYSTDLAEFVLMYDDIRQQPSPEKLLLEFFRSCYEAGATLAHWDRHHLEKPLL